MLGNRLVHTSSRVRILLEVLEVRSAAQRWHPRRLHLPLPDALPVDSSEPRLLEHVLSSVLACAEAFIVFFVQQSC